MSTPGLAIRPPKPAIRLAVAAAVAAYARSGHMLDAALAYIAHGIPVFPVDPETKTPIPRRDNDANGKPIPGTGGVYKASLEPEQVHAWWDRHEYWIGIPMGPRTGVWATDADTKEEHEYDGVKAWEQLRVEHAQRVYDRSSDQHFELTIDTRTHKTRSSGLHNFFNWDEELPIGCGHGALPPGIDVKGKGGYVVVPPSQRNGRAYTVARDIDPIDAPQWLTDLILEHRLKGDVKYSGPITADLKEIAEALEFCPNDDPHWDAWTKMGLAIFASTEGRGFVLFDAWSQKHRKYDGENTLQRWEEIMGCPPNRIGVGYIFRIARENGWVRKAEPTYTADVFTEADAARDATQRHIEDFISGKVKFNPFAAVFYWNQGREAPYTSALRVTTGVGKTERATKALAATDGKLAVYAVDRHKLSVKIEEQFRDHGIKVRIFYGRDQVDPVHYDPNKSEDEQIKMCLRPEAVAAALKARASVAETCCKKGKMQCPLLPQCGYIQQQMTDEQIDTWIVASDQLFHSLPVIKGRPDLVIIDEAFWAKGITQEGEHIAVGSLMTDVVDFATPTGERDALRNTLGKALAQQEGLGGVERRHLAEALSAEECTRAISLEWSLLPKFTQHPGTSDAEIQWLAKSELLDTIAHTRRVIDIWETVRDLLRTPEIDVSGRLMLKKDNGQRLVEWRGVRPISDQFQVPTLLLDATLPDLEVLRVYYPMAEITADIKVGMPHVHIRQVLGAPTSAGKLIKTSKLKEPEQHLHAVKRYIWQRWFETGRQRSLIICQMEVEAWLRGKLPPNVELEHFNDIAGLDDYKDVRLLVLVGRTMPGPEAPEALAGALSGRLSRLKSKNSFTWYPQVKRGIRMVDGSGVAVDSCDQHPDPFVESIRWQICEAELVQAIGRARGINRTAASPLDIDVLANVVLPISMNAVGQWKAPSLLIETAIADGVMCASPSDLVRVWPTIWPNEKAAYRTIQEGVPVLPGFERMDYQLVGPKMKRREAFIDRRDPMAWLEERLGPLARPRKR